MARTRGFLWLLAGLVVALIAGLVAFQTLQRATEAPVSQESAVPQVEVVAAVRPLAVRSLLTAEDLTLVSLPVTAAPEGSLRRVDDAVGRLALTDLYPGEPILAQRLLDPNTRGRDGRTALFLVEDEVLMAVPAADLLGKLNILRPGDRVDLLFSLQVSMERPPGAPSLNTIGDDLQTFTLLQNLTIAAVVGGQAPAQTGGAFGVTTDPVAPATRPEAFLLTVPAQDALVVKYLIDAGGMMDLVLRAPGAERPFDVDPVDMDYIIDRYDLPFQVGR